MMAVSLLQFFFIRASAVSYVVFVLALFIPHLSFFRLYFVIVAFFWISSYILFHLVFLSIHSASLETHVLLDL